MDLLTETWWIVPVRYLNVRLPGGIAMDRDFFPSTKSTEELMMHQEMSCWVAAGAVHRLELCEGSEGLCG